MVGGQVNQYEGQLSRLEGITAEYDGLNRKVKESAENYQLYKKKEEEARITDELDQNKITNVSVAEAPMRPQLPVRPNRPMNLLLGLFLGGLLSISGVVVAEFLRDTVLTPQELEGLTGRAVLACLPKNGRLPQTPSANAGIAETKVEGRQIVHDAQLEWARGD
jgi:hypothetical protein